MNPPSFDSDFMANYVDWLSSDVSLAGLGGMLVFLSITLGGKVLISIIGRKRDLYTENPNEDLPSFSIIIPTYNESTRVIEKINRVAELNYQSNLLEVIFVDSSDDDTPRLIEESRGIIPFKSRIVDSPRKVGLAGALDKAFKLAENDILMKSDSDISMEPDVLKKFAIVFSDQSVGAACACGTVKDPEREKFEVEYRKMKLEDRLNESLVDSTHIFDTVACIRKEIFGGIPGDSWADDAELAIQAVRYGKRAIVVPEIGFTEELPTGRKLRKIKSRRAAGHIRLMLQNLDLMFLGGARGYSRLVFPRILAMMTLCPILFFASSGVMAYTSLQFLKFEEIALLVLTVGFALLVSRRIRMISTSVVQVQSDLVIGMWILIQEYLRSKFSREKKIWEVIR